MPETENPSFYKHLEFDLSALRLDLFRLLSYFMASPQIRELSSEKYIEGANTEIVTQPFIEIEEEHFQKETGRILLQTAVFTRLILDESEADPEERPVHPCGFLEQDGKECAVLSLREACNKVIHSTKINYDRADDANKDSDAYKPTLYLYGSNQSGKEWKAILDVVRFTQFSAQVLRFRTISDFLEYESTAGNI